MKKSRFTEEQIAFALKPAELGILSTFEQLHQSKGDVFERGVINVFKRLSWDYKSNSPCKFGKKIIVEGLVSHTRWGFSFNGGLAARSTGRS
jgi:hypothetical protein